MSILQIDFSPRKESISKQVADYLSAKLKEKNPGLNFSKKHLQNTGFVTENIIGGFYTPEDMQNDEIKASITPSNNLVQELVDSDILILSFPMYNFMIPANLKAYIDLVVRPDITFRVDDTGTFHGLLKNKKIYTVMATGGTPFQSSYDLATPYLKHIFGFMGVTDVQSVGVSFNQKVDTLQQKIDEAKVTIDDLF